MSLARDARDWVQAYHDGELGWLDRRRAERRLRRDARSRRELESYAALRLVVQEIEAERPTPDLWPGVERRLAAIDAEIAQAAQPRRARAPGWPGLMRPLATGALVAAAIAGLMLFFAPGEPAPMGVVRWLDTEGRPVMLLERADEATIIWLMEPSGDHVGDRGSHAFI